MPRKRRSKRRTDPEPRRSGSSSAPALHRVEPYYELEVVPGLAEFAQIELRERTDNQAHLLPSAREDRVRFRYEGQPTPLLQLRRSVAVHCVQPFAIPRPKALLGHQHFEILAQLIQGALMYYEPGSFKTFSISAAGSRSSVFSRIKTEIEARTGLPCAEGPGDLLLAVRRAGSLPQDTPEKENGWEVAVRLSPRPLSTRPWRVCDMPGALNGTVASTMMSLTHPTPEDRIVNLACGSGTLLIERLALVPFRGAVGCDIDPSALACALQNLTASGNASAVSLLRCDAGRVPLSSGWATTVCVDLPFGMLVGTHQSNRELYPRLLVEASRLIKVGGRLTVITQEVRLFERVVAAQSDAWTTTRVIHVKLPASTRSGYIRPRIYLLRRR